VFPLLILLGGPLAGSALASGPAGSDPSSNYAIGTLPRACETAPTGSVCVDAVVSYLDQARASLGQPPYSLPADFASLAPIQQTLILTNEDRLLYNLAPISGLTNALDQDAAEGVTTDSDPEPSSSDDWYGFTSNAAWGDVNMVAAYEGWMYDDGPGSDNVDCTSSDASGCWGHRHDILWEFGSGTLAMGAASGTDSSGNPAYTMLLIQGSPAYNPVFTYTWAQALADGAGSSGSSSPGGVVSSAPSGTSSTGPGGDSEARGARVAIKVKLVQVRGHRVTVRVTAPRGTGLSCSLRRAGRHFRRLKACSHTVTFSHLPAGRYQLRISSGALTVTRGVRVR